jgi:hypothetical protein
MSLSQHHTHTWTGYRGLGSLEPLQLLHLDARRLDLNNCGAPEYRRSDLYVEFPKSYVYQIDWEQDAVNPQFFLDERRQVDSRSDFLLDRVITFQAVNGVAFRFMWPNGRFSANTYIPSVMQFAAGDNALQYTDAVTIPAGEKIGIEFEIAAGTPSGSFAMTFDGRVRYYLQPAT